jgi:protein farnesyltransferase/geranylgeranyltransferase type-1 subunit alpha
VYVLVTLADQQLMDLFRAIVRSGELSERVLDLTEDLLDENAANYTVWLDYSLRN